MLGGRKEAEGSRQYHFRGRRASGREEVRVWCYDSCLLNAFGIKPRQMLRLERRLMFAADEWAEEHGSVLSLFSYLFNI